MKFGEYYSFTALMQLYIVHIDNSKKCLLMNQYIRKSYELRKRCKINFESDDLD
jgi:hypothetical protein